MRPAEAPAQAPASQAALCRVCLADGGFLSLFADTDDTKVYLKVMACSSVQICEEDGFPNTICLVCYSMLNTAFEFKKKCELSDMKLRNRVEKQALKVEEDDYNFEFDGENFLEEEESYNYEDVKPFPVDEIEVDIKPSLESDKILEINKKKVPKKKKKWKPQETSFAKNTIKKIKKTITSKLHKNTASNNIATSLLEGKCTWNGREWRFEVTKKDDIIKKVGVPELKIEKVEETQNNRKKERRKLSLKMKPKSVNLCDTCGKTFKSKYHLKYHIVLKHQESVGTIKCLDPNCKKIFKLDNYMIRHVKRCHSAKREFVCNECGKQYAFISGLKQHMKSHSENLVWKHCNFCTQKYRTQKSVDIHVRSVHTGERPSVCSVCNSAFFHDDYLKEHMRLHTGETPYKCPICKRGYAQRGNMKSHMKQHRLSELDEVTKATMKPNYLKLLRDC